MNISKPSLSTKQFSELGTRSHHSSQSIHNHVHKIPIMIQYHVSALEIISICRVSAKCSWVLRCFEWQAFIMSNLAGAPLWHKPSSKAAWMHRFVIVSDSTIRIYGTRNDFDQHQEAMVRISTFSHSQYKWTGINTNCEYSHTLQPITNHYVYAHYPLPSSRFNSTASNCLQPPRSSMAVTTSYIRAGWRRKEKSNGMLDGVLCSNSDISTTSMPIRNRTFDPLTFQKQRSFRKKPTICMCPHSSIYWPQKLGNWMSSKFRDCFPLRNDTLFQTQKRHENWSSDLDTRFSPYFVFWIEESFHAIFGALNPETYSMRYLMLWNCSTIQRDHWSLKFRDSFHAIFHSLNHCILLRVICFLKIRGAFHATFHSLKIVRHFSWSQTIWISRFRASFSTKSHGSDFRDSFHAIFQPLKPLSLRLWIQSFIPRVYWLSEFINLWIFCVSTLWTVFRGRTRKENGSNSVVIHLHCRTNGWRKSNRFKSDVSHCELKVDTLYEVIRVLNRHCLRSKCGNQWISQWMMWCST